MPALRILARNLANTAVITASPAMVESGGISVENLGLDTERGRTARSTSAASQDLKLSWATNQSANMIAVARHNWTTSSTLREIIYPNADWTGTPLYDPGATAAFSTSGLDTDIDVYTEHDFLMLKNTVRYFTALTTMKSLIARILDTSNPDGFLQQNRLFIGKYFEFTYNPDHGDVELQLMDESAHSRADDGTQHVDRKYKARRLTLNLNFVPDADLPSLLALVRYLGKHGEAWVDLYPGVTSAKGLYNRMPCRLVDSPTFNPHQYGLHRNTLVFEET